MEPLILTPRLKLTQITKAERGSPELEWLHELRSDEKSMWWSIVGRSKSLEITEEANRLYLPEPPVTTDVGGTPGGEKSYRVVYAVHQLLGPEEAQQQQQPVAQPGGDGSGPSRFIGTVALRSLDARSLELPEHLFPPQVADGTLVIELSYMLLPLGWGKGFASEAVTAVLGECERSLLSAAEGGKKEEVRGESFWAPYSRVHIRAIVNDENPASLRVMAKSRFAKRGIYEFTKPPLFLGGEWRTEHKLHIWDLRLGPAEGKEN